MAEIRVTYWERLASQEEPFTTMGGGVRVGEMGPISHQAPSLSGADDRPRTSKYRCPSIPFWVSSSGVQIVTIQCLKSYDSVSISEIISPPENDLTSSI